MSGYVDGFINGTLVPSVAANALTIAIKTLAGNDPSAADPVHVVLRNATAATGNYVVLAITAATSLVISSGSTLGAASNTPFRVWIVGFNDAGTFRLGAQVCTIANRMHRSRNTACVRAWRMAAPALPTAPGCSIPTSRSRRRRSVFSAS